MTAPEHIKKFNRMRKKADMLVETTKMHGREAYDTATKKHLMNEEDYLDYEKLEDEGTQDKFAKEMSNVYLEKAKKAFKSGISGKDEFENDLLMSAYAGVTQSALVRSVKDAGKKFTYDQFHGSALDSRNPQSIINQMKGRLYQTAEAHLEQKHVDDIVKYVKAEDFLDSNKMRRDDAVKLLHEYYDEGGIKSKDYQNDVFAKKSYFKRKKAESA